ncbi:carotene biosynthesis protein [Aquiflexum balticum]|uniref:carotene biosynthesis protein n=1 Tax=Aquiflexum balticum TaxID=280473 RepID=UPI001E3FB781|nr:carotene biosynthesis protein [Aquiflexum balticum]
MKATVFGILFVLTLLVLGYMVPREDFVMQLIGYVIAFGSYLLLVFEFEYRVIGLWSGIVGAVILRMVFIVALPELSDDFYRYFYDGQLLRNGINPYLYLPHVAFVETGIVSNAYWEMLLTQMNSPAYFSVYPPLHQVIFWISAMSGENLLYNIVTIRFIIIAFDILNIFLIWKITQEWKVSNQVLWLYAFNPLVIIEISGNLHLEGIVLTGLLLSIYAFSKKKQFSSSLGWSLAVGLKLTPLIIGPLWLKAWKGKKLISFLVVSGLVILILLIPLTIGNGAVGFLESLRLYQRNFEFNASIYYFLREIISFFLGYNPIAYLGPALNLVAFFGILGFVYFWKVDKAEDLAEGIVLLYLIFLLLQPVVHPWYLIPAFGISVLTKNRVFLIWSFLVFLSYAAYRYPEVKESWLLLGVEYGVLFGYLGYKISRAYQ